MQSPARINVRDESILIRPDRFASASEVLKMLRAVAGASTQLPKEIDCRNVVEGACSYICRMLDGFERSFGVVVAYTHGGELRLELPQFKSRETTIQYRPVMSRKDDELLAIRRLAAFYIDIEETQGQLRHPAKIASLLRDVEDAVTRFANDRQALEVLDTLTTAVRQAEMSGAPIALAAFKLAPPGAHLEFECKPFCARDDDDAANRMLEFGAEWSNVRLTVPHFDG